MPWKNPPPATNEFDLINLAGELAFFVVGGCHPAQNTRFGVKPVIRCAVVILTGPEAGKEYVDVLVFNSRVVRRLRGVPGEVVLGRISIDATGTNRAVELEDPSPQDEQAAQGWHNYYPNRLAELTKLTYDAFVAEEHRQAQQAQQPPSPLPRQASPASGASWGQPTQPVQPSQPPAWGQSTTTTNPPAPTWGPAGAQSPPSSPTSAPWLNAKPDDDQPGY
jgi:hypothetical protein